MDPALMTEVSYLKGVGPQRAELLNERGIRTLEDLLACLPFRYEDRIRFSNIREIEPDKTYTVRATVASGGAVRYARGGNAIYHLLVQDATGSLHCKFFHGGYLESRLKPGRSEEHTLNSSHLGISYAVFCLKKKTKKNTKTIYKK